MHALEISHRDFKPENLFRVDGRWLIGDFGLADFSNKLAITQRGERIGPLLYSAPEMLNDASTSDGRAADIFSLAKVLWVLITGQNFPVPGRLDSRTDSTRISTYVENSDVIVLEPLLDSATSEEPAHRPSAHEFAVDLSSWLDSGKELSQRSLTGIDLSDFVDRHSFAKAQLAEAQHAQIEAESRGFDSLCQSFLSRFNETIARIVQQFNSLGPHSKAAQAFAQGGPSHLPYIFTNFDRDTANTYIWQNVASMLLKAGSAKRDFPLYCGISISQPAFKAEMGGFYPIRNTKSLVGAGFYLTDNELQGNAAFRCSWFDASTLLLGGPSEDDFAHRLITGISANFRRCFEEYRRYANER
jgi:serine/threonine protein kinase